MVKPRKMRYKGDNRVTKVGYSTIAGVHFCNPNKQLIFKHQQQTRLQK